MDVLHVIAAGLNWVIYSSVETFRLILDINYNLMTAVLHHICFAYTTVRNITTLLITAFSYTLNDFALFICELLYAAATTIQFFLDAINNVVLFLQNLFSSLLYLIFKIYTFFDGVCNVISSQIMILVEVIKQISILIFSGVILLLQLLPNLIIFLVSGVHFCTIHVFETVVRNTQNAQRYGKSFLSNCYKECFSFLQSIPLNAYVGLFLLLLLYYNQKPLHRLFRLLVNFIQYKILQILTFILGSIYSTGEVLQGAFIVLRYVMVEQLQHLLNFMQPTSQIKKLFDMFLILVTIFGSLFGKTLSFFMPWFLRETQENEEQYLDDDDEDESAHFVNDNLENDLPSVSSLQRKPLRSIKLDTTDDDEEDKSNDRESHKKLVKEMLDQLEKERDRHLCIICQDRPKSMMLLPCRHLCMCQPCCNDFLSQAPLCCPICRRHILDIMHVFT